MHKIITDFANTCTFTQIVGHLVRIYDDFENILNNMITYIGPRKFFIRSSWLSLREGNSFIFVLGILKESGMTGRASLRKLIPGVEWPFSFSFSKSLSRFFGGFFVGGGVGVFFYFFLF